MGRYCLLLVGGVSWVTLIVGGEPAEKAPSEGGSCRRKATEGAVCMDGIPFQRGFHFGKIHTVPNALQPPPPSGATRQLPPPLGEEAFAVGFICRESVQLRWRVVFFGCRSFDNPTPECSRIFFSSQQPARTATIESDVKSLCPFSGRHKGRTV